MWLPQVSLCFYYITITPASPSHCTPTAQADFYREQLVQEAAGAQAALESERVRLRGGDGDRAHSMRNARARGAHGSSLTPEGLVTLPDDHP